MTESSAAMPPNSIDELLSAYLDNELSPQACEEVEQLLSDDTRARERLQQMQNDWDMLDLLPVAEVSDQFTHTTLNQVAAVSQEEVTRLDTRARRRNWWMYPAAAAGVLLAAGIGFGAMWRVATRENRQLVRDIELIENLDAYQQIENIEFLQELEKSGLFDDVDEEAANDFPAS